MRTFAIVAALLASVTVARADVDIPRADALFAEAIALKSTDPVAACAKFEASLALNPQALGTLLNVALCDETSGRIASAVAKFTEARDRAQEQSLPDYVKAADEHLTALRPELPYVAIRFEVPPGSDTKLLLDDRVIPLDGSVDLTSLPVDPGARRLAVSQPGRVTYETTVSFAKRERKVVAIPALRAAVTVKSNRRMIGKITLGVGVLGVASGVVVGYLANRDYDRVFVDGECVAGDPPLCTGPGQSDASAARNLGNVGTVIGIVGVAAAVTGAVLWLTAPSARRTTERSQALRLLPSLSPESAGLTAVGTF